MNVQPLTPTTGDAQPVDDKPISLTKAQLVAAFTLWEADFRAGRCMPSHEVEQLPEGEAARRNAAALLVYLDPDL